MLKTLVLAVTFVAICRSCTFDQSCKQTYIYEAATLDPCAAANTYKACVTTMTSTCTDAQKAEGDFKIAIDESDAYIISNCNAGPPPLPPGDGGAPTNCYSATCESTYMANVAQGDACAVAETFVNCVGQMKAACGATIPPEVTTTEGNAQAAQSEKCSGPPVPPPLSPSCSDCDSYKPIIQNLMMQPGVLPSTHCPVRADHLGCLHRCGAQQSVIDAVAAENLIFCQNYIKENCTILYMHCDIGLPVLHLQNPTSVCDFWYICAAEDFSLCGERLSYNYSAQCDPLKPPVPPPQPTDGSSPPPVPPPQPTDGSSPPPVQGPQPTDGSSPSPGAQPSVNNDKNRTPTLGPVIVVMITTLLAAFFCSKH
ncbi:uncharacterized protein LOC126824642 isoform X1 [Patella vulgata]|uniref:uncharacterized protein LOC126824642 isoform X1 n=1 Tax=Patella vulgata TaxID=6465 RepID=UPI0021804F52|nr:uncharacterized protein LOC126824642 isoform X1 [Patella vulgata]